MEKVKIKKIISGGQTGGDMGGLLAGKLLAIETGGTAPKGWKTENRSNPDLGSEFNLVESSSPHYVDRTIKNVIDSDGTVAFLWGDSVGTGKTIGYCRTGVWKYSINESEDSGYRPVLVIDHKDECRATDELVKFISRNTISVLNVAGHRESSQPGIERFVRKVLVNTLEPNIKIGDIIKIEGQHRHWVCLKVTQDEIDNTGINACYPGLYAFGGMWYGDNPQDRNSFGKILPVSHNDVIIGRIEDYPIEELKKLCD